MIERRLAVVVDILGNAVVKTIKAEDLERLKSKLTPGTEADALLQTLDNNRDKEPARAAVNR